MLATRMRMSGMADFYPYKINQSCRFNDDDSAHLHWIPGTSTDGKKKTISTWIKRGNLSTKQGIFDAYYNANNLEEIILNTSNKLVWYLWQDPVTSIHYISTQVFRDVGGWYHFLFVQDTTEATAADRIKVYCNGEEITAWDTQTVGLSLNAINPYLFRSSSVTSRIGRFTDAGTYYDGYQAETIFIDGQALTPSDFGKEKNGIWIPKKYTGSYGDNGFYLDFADSADLGNDVSGNNNDFTSSGLASNDKVLDSPTNNYPTLLSTYSKLQAPNNMANGGLYYLTASSALDRAITSTALPETGKWYFEGIISNESYGVIGVSNYDFTIYDGYSSYDGKHWIPGVDTAYGDAYVNDDVIGCAVDIDNEKITWYRNNVSQGEESFETSYTGYPIFFFVGDNSSSTNDGWDVNFGQLGFTYTPPTGYKALCSNNLPTPSIKNSATGFDVVTYTGDATVRDITDLSFQLDLVWIKNRDQADEHKLIDSVRGVTKELSSNSTNVESTDANGLTAFLSNGFSLGTGAAGYNDNAESFVAWCFRVGVKYGFDIQTYEGTGVAHAENHDLGGVPELMIIKNLESSEHWIAYQHHALNKTDPETDYGILDTIGAWADLNTMWNDTTPTSSQFTVGVNGAVNENLKDHVGYLWRSIPGFSKVFSYTGNGNANGPFVHCGFRPKYIMLKNSEWL
jgi:hypothetical protein